MSRNFGLVRGDKRKALQEKAEQEPEAREDESNEAMDLAVILAERFGVL